MTSDSIAGSTLNLNVARKNLKVGLNVSEVTLAKLTATNSARLLGISDKKGSIAIGKDADFFVVNEEEDVVLTVSEGRIIFKGQC